LVQALLDGEDRFRDLLAKHRAILAEHSAAQQRIVGLQQELTELRRRRPETAHTPASAVSE
jgi:hypothetical protein